MPDMDGLADPEVALAVAYAPKADRPALTTLFALDARFGRIVATTTEPMIGLMRLAWWREALDKLDRQDAPAEPLLQAVRNDLLPHGITGAALAEMEDGWAALLDGEIDKAALERHGRARGATLFALAGRLLGDPDPRLAAAGAGWALSDLAHRPGTTGVRAAAREHAASILAGAPASWPTALRPLGMLAVLAANDAERPDRRQGHPSRLLRMLALRITGR